jgi:hypothetical protein
MVTPASPSDGSDADESPSFSTKLQTLGTMCLQGEKQALTDLSVRFYHQLISFNPRWIKESNLDCLDQIIGAHPVNGLLQVVRPIPRVEPVKQKIPTQKNHARIAAYLAATARA